MFLVASLYKSFGGGSERLEFAPSFKIVLFSHRPSSVAYPITRAFELKVPPELRQGSPNDMNVKLVDKSSEEYVPPPPPAYVAYSGDGQVHGER